MADTYVYAQDCEDFSNIGLCGRLNESKCEFEEEANGMSEITLEHPIDDEGRFALLIPGRILKCTVPVRSVPEVDPETSEYITTVQKWYVRDDATKLQRTVFNKRADQVKGKKKKRKLKVLKKGTRVTVLKTYALYPEYRVQVGKVKGYIDPDALRDGITINKPASQGIDDFYESVEPSWTAREQLFRIYSAKRTDDKVVVNARHIFYDNAYTVTTYNETGNVQLDAVLEGVQENVRGTCSLEFYTNIKGKRSGAHYADKNIVEALLDPEDGIAARWDADVIRDNEDCYLIDNAGYNRGVCLEYGHDLTGIEYTEDWENIATHIRPVGETAAGKALYLTDNDGIVVSPNANLYPFERVYVLKVSEAKVQKDVMTTAEARTKLRSAAEELLDKGVDMPTVNLSVKFELLGNSDRYAAYKDLKKLFLFDTVRVRHKALHVDTVTQIVRIVWDCKLERMTQVELGSLLVYTPTIASFQLASGINGTKIAPESISGVSFADGAIVERHIQAEAITANAIMANAITAAKIMAGAIETDKLAANAVTAAKIDAGAVTAGAIAAGAVTTEKLDAGAVTTNTLAAHAVTADKIAAGAVDAQSIAAVTAMIQNLTAADIQTNTFYAAFAHMMALTAGSIQAGSISADALAAVMAQIVSLTAKLADVDYLRVKDITANQAIITDGLAEELYIERLAVTSANMVNAVIGSLIVKGDDNKYYAIHVGAEGGIVTEEVTVSQEEIDAGETESGRQIVTTTVNAASLNGTTVKASEAILGTILTTALTAGSITAAEAMIASAQIPVLYTTAIRALGDTIDISANQSVTMAVGKAEMAQAAADSMLAYFSFDTSGLRTRKSGSKWSTLVGDDGFYIDHDEIAGHVSAFYRDKVVVDGVQIGDIIALKTEKGGWAWVSA